MPHTVIQRTTTTPPNQQIIPPHQKKKKNHFCLSRKNRKKEKNENTAINNGQGEWCKTTPTTYRRSRQELARWKHDRDTAFLQWHRSWRVRLMGDALSSSFRSFPTAHREPLVLPNTPFSVHPQSHFNQQHNITSKAAQVFSERFFSFFFFFCLFLRFFRVFCLIFIFYCGVRKKREHIEQTSGKKVTFCQTDTSRTGLLFLTRWSSHMNYCKVKVMEKWHADVASLVFYCLLSCREHATLLFCLGRPTVTLHQGQGHQNDHEHIWHPYVYRDAKFECNK